MSRLYIIVIVVVVVIVVNVIRIAIRSKNRHFVCPYCGNSFQVGFSKFFFTAHSLEGECRVTCPKCGKTNYIKPE